MATVPGAQLLGRTSPRIQLPNLDQGSFVTGDQFPKQLRTAVYSSQPVTGVWNANVDLTHRKQTGKRRGGGDGFGYPAPVAEESEQTFLISSQALTRRQGSRPGFRGVMTRVSAGSSDGVTFSDNIFDVEDPWTVDRPNQLASWEVLRNDMLYLDYRARQDVLAIKCVHDKMVEVLNPVAREQKSISVMRDQLEDLKSELSEAHSQVHISEARVNHSLQRLADLEAAIDKNILGSRNLSALSQSDAAVIESPPAKSAGVKERMGLDVSGPIAPYQTWLKNFWYPVAFSRDIDAKTLVPIDCFEEPWVLFRGDDGRPGCIRDQCAHRACPLSLGTVVDGRVQCPYHGWEFSTSGKCERMPSTKKLELSIQSLPCVEHEGLIWVWPGEAIPHATMPDLSPPPGFTIHAEIVIELPVEHGLLVENLLDLAHAPFTHTSTFAKGWEVPSLVRFNTAAAALQGHWDPYPIDMEFRPPCMVLSTIGIAKPGQLDGKSAKECKKHLFQLHCCIPSSRGKTRLLYRMALDFAGWARFVPFVDRVWSHLANQVLGEDLRLVLGQQDRMERGGNVWSNPVAYDKLGVRYRWWRKSVEAGEEHQPFS